MSNNSQVEVTGPDNRKYSFPQGTTKESAIAYFKKKGIGAQPQHMPGNTGGSSGSWDAAPPEATGAKGAAVGFMKGAADLVASGTEAIGNTIQRMRGKPTLSVDKTGLQPANTSQAIGSMAESATEYAAGEAGLKALTAALKVKNVAAVTALVAKYPRLAKIAEEGMKAAGIGTTLAAAHGEEHPVQAGITTGVFGAGGEAASQTLSKVAPAAIAKSSALMNRYIGLMKSDMPKWERFKAGSVEDIGKTVIESVGVKGTLAEQHAAIEAKRELVNAENEHMLSQVTARAVPLHANLNDIEFRVGQHLLDIGKLSDQASAGLKSVVQQLKDSYNPNMTVEDALALRRKIGVHIDFANLKTSDNPQQLVWGELYHSINDSIEQALPTGTARKFAANNKLQQRLMIARDAAAEKINAEGKAKGPGMVSKVAGMVTGAAVGAGLGAAAGSRFGNTGEGAIFGAAAGAGVGHGTPKFDWARADIKASLGKEATSKALKKAAPLLARLAKKSPMAARAIQSITDAHGGGSGALAAQN